MGVLTQNYEIIREIGRGGMGAVYLANDKRLDRQVAIKVLQLDPSLDNAASTEIIQRFQKEARAIAKLNHPNIVSIYDIGEENSRYYMVIELLEGQALSNMVERKERLSHDSVLSIGIQICAALSYAHKNGIVHRDIKPANIMFSQENIAKLTDFGIAQLGNDKLSLTQAGSILGSILYIPPEQLIDSRKVDKRADIYSLGVTLFQLFTGRLPFEGETVAEVITKILNQEVPSMRSFDPAIPEHLDEIILKAMKKEPTERYEEVSELGKALTNYRLQPSLYSNHSANNEFRQNTKPSSVSDSTLIIPTKGNGTSTTRNEKKNSTTQKLAPEGLVTKGDSGPLKGTVPLKGFDFTKKFGTDKTIPLVIGGITLGIILLVTLLALIFGGNNKTSETHNKTEPSPVQSSKPENIEKPVSKPVHKPTAKPVEKPIAKPTAVKPVVKAIVKPVSKPVEKPVYRPAPVQPKVVYVKPVSKPVIAPKPVPKVIKIEKPVVTQHQAPVPGNKKSIGEGY
jgi:serine/threonine protein kinase